MKKSILLSFIIFCLIAGASAQQAAPEPAPATQSASPFLAERQLTAAEKQEIDSRFEALRGLGDVRRNNRMNAVVALQIIRNFYREPTKQEFKQLEPDKEDLKKYAQFLRQPETGMVRLIADHGCPENIKVISVDCLKYSMPGAGSSYSFRAENYRIRRLSDLTYTGGSFQSSGILAHAILVDLGDVSLEDVSLETGGLKFLSEFQAVTDFEKAKEIDRQFTIGVKKDGFFYSRRQPVVAGTTFALRSIAYQGSLFRSERGWIYDEFDFDERKDVTVAFRIVRLDAESVTLLWKRLASQKSPSIKIPNLKLSEREDKFVAEQVK